jgi:hypothetical protein
VVLVGVPGLSWGDVDADTTPTLWELAGGQAVGNLSVRAVPVRSCATDAWLTVSAGRRAGDQVTGRCGSVPTALPDGAGGAEIPAWPNLQDAPAQGVFAAPLGLLGERLRDAAVCSTAFGPGAALALADSDGTVERFRPGLSITDAELTRELAACPVSIVDLGSLPAPQLVARRAAAASDADAAVARLLTLLPKGGTLLVGGLADSGPTPAPGPDGRSRVPQPAVRLVIAAGGAWEPVWLASASTRWPGVVQLTDFTPTLLEAAGVDDLEGLAGAPLRAGRAHPGTSIDTVGELVDLDQAEKIFRKRYSSFYQLLGYAQAAVYGGTLLLIGWYEPRGRRRVRLGPAITVAFVAAALPVASFLTNLTGWWRADRPELALWVTVLAIASAIGLLAARGPWRRSVWGAPLVIAGLTAMVLGVDVLTGSTLQHLSLLGLSPTVAGRFYGFGNIPFAIFASSVFVVAAAVADLLRRRGATPRLQGGVVLALGLAGAAIVGAPTGGADFGGLLSMVPGAIVFAALVGRVRLSWSRLLAVGAVTVAVVAAVSFLDYLRPPQMRTHFGDFVASIVDGSAAITIERKARASFGTLDNAYSWLVPVAYLVVWRLLLSRRHPLPPAVVELTRLWPAFRHLVVALMVTGALGFALNDSGMIVPAMMASTAIPLAVIALVDARRSTQTVPTPARDATAAPVAP